MDSKIIAVFGIRNSVAANKFHSGGRTIRISKEVSRDLGHMIKYDIRNVAIK